jgi:hypothetical protein
MPKVLVPVRGLLPFVIATVVGAVIVGAPGGGGPNTHRCCNMQPWKSGVTGRSSSVRPHAERKGNTGGIL